MNSCCDRCYYIVRAHLNQHSVLFTIIQSVSNTATFYLYLYLYYHHHHHQWSSTIQCGGVSRPLQAVRYPLANLPLATWLTLKEGRVGGCYNRVWGRC